MKVFRLRKSERVLITVYQLLRRKKKKLLPAQVGEIKNDLMDLQEQILKKNRENASHLAHKCLDYSRGILKKNSWEQIRDFTLNLLFALIIALLIRQTWFELYEIPTGSMRPTFKEKDRLVVSKTDFGINYPFRPGHFYFDPKLVKRLGTVVFTVENMDVHDSDTMYFYIFPGKKQYVKRMIGLPGDILYFYGGKIYGIDKEGRDISDQLQLKRLSKIDHIPFIRFEGRVSFSEPFQSNQGSGFSMAIIHQMNAPVARMTRLRDTRVEGEMLYTPLLHYRNAPLVKDYSKLWGFGNYATARVVNKDQIRGLIQKYDLDFTNGDLFLELQHSPSLNKLELGKDLWGRVRPKFILSRSILPLDEAHLKALFSHLYTARFVVKNGFAKRYRAGSNKMGYTHILPRLSGIPDGIYEFYDGKAYEIKWGGVAKELSKNHPLAQYSSEKTKILFNFGIDFDNRFVKAENFDTGRFAYFRRGNLYLLGRPIFKKGESPLDAFVEKEKKRADMEVSYRAFIDPGPPTLQDGKIDKAFIQRYGIVVPPKMYLVLGDNFAMSADSRDFGFVPQANLRGAPSFLFWPPSNRFGAPNQPSYPWLSSPRIFIWLLAFIGYIIWYMLHRRTHKLPLKFDL